MNEISKRNVADLIAGLAWLGRDDPTIADRLGLTARQVRDIRKEFDIAAGERRWLPTRRPDATA